MPVLTKMRTRPQRPIDDRTASRELVEQVATCSIAIAVDPAADVSVGAAELARLAGEDRSVLGRAWLEVVIPALRRPSRQLIDAERLLAAALETDGGIALSQGGDR